MVGGWTDRMVKPVDQRNIKLRRMICLELIFFIPAFFPEKTNKLRINRGCGQVNIVPPIILHHYLVRRNNHAEVSPYRCNCQKEQTQRKQDGTDNSFHTILLIEKKATRFTFFCFKVSLRGLFFLLHTLCADKTFLGYYPQLTVILILSWALHFQQVKPLSEVFPEVS
jgi:hypothetical protein